MMNHKSNELSLTVKELLIEIHKLTLQLSSMEFGGERPGPQQTGGASLETSQPANTRRKKFQYEFFKYLVNVHAPHHHFHLETLFANGTLTNENLYTALKNRIEKLYGIVQGFRQSEETFIGDHA